MISGQMALDLPATVGAAVLKVLLHLAPLRGGEVIDRSIPLGGPVAPSMCRSYFRMRSTVGGSAGAFLRQVCGPIGGTSRAVFFTVGAMIGRITCEGLRQVCGPIGDIVDMDLRTVRSGIGSLEGAQVLRMRGPVGSLVGTTDFRIFV